MYQYKRNKRFIFIYLALHTISVSIFVRFIPEIRIPPPLLAVSVVIFVVSLTVYTAYKISKYMTQELADSMKTISQLSDYLRKQSAVMAENAKRLEHYTNLFGVYAKEADDLLKKVSTPDNGYPDKKG